MKTKTAAQKKLTKIIFLQKLQEQRNQRVRDYRDRSGR